MRFFGATFDPSGLYRLNAIMRWLLQLGVDFSMIHAHVQRLQRRFVDALDRVPVPALPLDRLVPTDDAPRGNFLTFGPVQPRPASDRRTACPSTGVETGLPARRATTGLHRSAGGAVREALSTIRPDQTSTVSAMIFSRKNSAPRVRSSLPL
jgi:hypothetical protein